MWKPGSEVDACLSLPLDLQYFQGRLNTTEWINGTVVVHKDYYFNNWMTLLSQLPLLLFTLLNSFLYQRSVSSSLFKCPSNSLQRVSRCVPG